jgi:predicted ATPase/signal transduction histidine kinase
MIGLKGYSISEKVFQNQTTAVFRGTRESDKAPIIAKVLLAEYPKPKELARFRHQYDLIKDLDVVGIVKIYSLEKLGNTLAIIMDDFGGVALKSTNSRAMGLLEKLTIALNITKVLDNIHRQGILHNDFNPANVLINMATGEIKVIDFELASIFSHKSHQLKSPDNIEGTLAYISPERTGRMNRPVDYRSDYYSLGITIYELLSGERPFETNDHMEMVHMHMAVKPPALHVRDCLMPSAISLIVDKLMAKNAENRYQSAVGVIQDLDACIRAIATGKQLGEFIPGLHDASDKFNIPSKLYGREKELDVLNGVFDRVCSGRQGIMLVTGASGIGKSTLVNEIHKPIARQRGCFATGKFDQYRRNIPYSSFIQAFQDLLRQILTESDERITTWREQILSAVGSNGQVLMEVIPELRHIIGDQPDVTPLPPQESKNRFNYYFRNFVRVFAGTGQPLVLFLDDLQWADNPSLNLIELLASDSTCANLLIIGAYRENEVESSHPLMLAIDRLKNAGLEIESISLQNLSEETVCEITADALNCKPSEARPLASLIHKRTEGTPFFVNQLLKNLHDNRLVSYDYDSGRWVWDIVKIKQVSVSDNVVELMAGKIKKLPPRTQELLKLAACIGNQFALHDLSVVSSLSADAVADIVSPALKEDLIIPIGEDYKYLEYMSFKEGSNSKDAFQILYGFLHDRIQQAAYGMLSEEEKTRIHLKVGEVFLNNTPADLLDEKIFIIANHFNRAVDLIDDEALRVRLASLNLRAAVKAKASIAYQPALEHIKMALNFLTGLEVNNRDLSFRLLVERAECEYLNGNAGAAKELYGRAVKQSSNQEEKAEVFEAMIHFYSNIGDFRGAYDIGRKAVKMAGVTLQAGFVPPLFLMDLAKLKWKMRGKKTADLLNLPLCKDETHATAMRLIVALLKASYQIRPELCVANAVKAMNLSLDHGTIEDNAVAYLVFGGIFIGGVIGNHKAGYEFGNLALAMNSRFDNLKQRSEVNFVSGYFTNFWLEHARNTEEYYRTAYESGLQTGDFFHVSCASCTLVESQFIRGVPLSEVKKLGEDYLAFMKRIDSREAAGAITATIRAVLNLEGLTESPSSFGDAGFAEQEFVDRIKGFTSLHFTHFYFVNKMISLLLWGKHEEAMKTAGDSEGYLKYSLAMLHTAEHHFWHGLILCSVYDLKKNGAHLKKAGAKLKKLEKWAELNPANFKHKALLLKAEIKRRKGAGLAVSGLYTEAIQLADENGFLNVKALGNELAGRFYAANNINLSARDYLREACYCYQIWGAKGIAEKLEREFSQILSLVYGFQSDSTRKGSADIEDSTYTRTGSTTSGSKEHSGFDLESIMKSTQAISGEIRLASLLEKLMKVIIENAGAERGCFIRVDEDKLFLEAEGAINEKGMTRLEHVPLEEARVPISILKYVIRTRESVVLGDASSDLSFGKDPYFLSENQKSVLCAPIIHQGMVAGIVYLENNLASHIFNPNRLRVIQVIAGQVASAVNNAHLYADMEQKVLERTASLQKAKEVAEEATKMKDKFVSLASHDLRAPLGNIVTAMHILRSKGENVDSSTRTKFEDMVSNSANALLRLIEQLLDITRLQTGKIELKKQSVAPKYIAAEIVSGLGQLAEKKGIQIENNLPEDFRLIVDPILFREVVHNLVSNSIKFSRVGDQITIYRGLPGENVLYVKDTGAGISPRILKDIFKSEVKTSTPGTAGELGTGLGLPYCQDIIKAHGGEITIESEPGKGSIFKVSLRPFDVLILIADDQEAHRKMMREIIMTSVKAEFIEAENGMDALVLLKDIAPNLIVSDINMPVMDGYQFTAEARQMEHLGRVPIIIASSIETSNGIYEAERIRVLSLGANDLIVKPVVAKEFLFMVNRLLADK